MSLYSISIEFIPLASPYRTVPNRTEPSFFKNTSTFKSDVFTHRCIEKYTVTLDCNGKFDRHTARYSYCYYRML